MDIHTATEQAYKNGYEQGKKDAVVHGQWILGYVKPGYFTPGGNRPWICSECRQVVSWMLDKPQDNYCSNCGTKMDGELNG